LLQRSAEPTASSGRIGASPRARRARSNAYSENPNGAATLATHRIIYEIDTGKLWYDSNGSAAGGTIFFAALDANKAALYSNAHFLVI
jgi:hypothetical protein